MSEVSLEVGGWGINMVRPGKLAILDHGSKPVKASAMRLPWWKHLLGEWRHTL